jgi:hypothetical protein
MITIHMGPMLQRIFLSNGNVVRIDLSEKYLQLRRFPPRFINLNELGMFRLERLTSCDTSYKTIERGRKNGT